MFNKNIDKNSREYLEGKVSTARHSLLAVIIFTIINLGMILADTGSYFVFSASVPYELTFIGAVLTYEATGAILGVYTYTALVISAIILAVYGLCWFFAKKKPVWYVVAFVLFALDTVVMVLINVEYIADYIIDIVFHAYVLYELFQAISANNKLKTMPVEAEDLEEPVVASVVPEAERYADPWDRANKE